MFSKIQMSICDKIREAREWGKCVDTLKASVDSMYEICHKQQNIMGCEEAIMFLKHAIRDFHCLIDTIKIEQNWESSEERPMTSVAWEIRGTVSRNSLLQKKEKECQTQNVPTAAATSSSAATATVLPTKPKEEEWQLVQRRKSTSSRQTLLENWTGVPFARPPIGLVVKAPKSAMDLPQTKSSMAKMAYSRQLLFEKSRQVFMEKLNSNKRSRKQPTNSGAHNQNELSKQAAPAAMGGGTKADNSAAQQNPMAMEGIEQRVVAVIRQNSEPPPDCLKMLIDKLSDDCEWRAMTEEEQSLAQEEASLKKEIEEEENLSPFEDDDEDFVDDGIADIVMDQAESSSGVLARIPPAEKPEEKQQQQQTTTTVNGGAGAGGEKEKEATTNVNVIHFWNPGEIAQLRAKLLSPTKRRRMEEMDSENKLKRAEELRNALQQERAQRLQLLHQRVEEVRNKREQIQQRKLAHLETVKERIQRAGENRTKGLEEIIQRAKEDELKIMEITLLNNFGAANQKLEKRYTQIRARNRYLRLLQKAEEERQRRIEENKQQKEAAERRRNDAEKLRTKRLQEQALDQQQRQCHALKHRVKALEKYKARVAQHSQRVCQRKARELEEKQQLLDRIQQKHEKRTENYEQCKEQVRRRAMELSSPRPCHLWAQSLADFSHSPSDLCLLSLQQQLHHHHSPQHQQPRPHSSLQDQQQQQHSTTTMAAAAAKSCGALKSAVDQQQQQSLTCFRCKTKIHSDLQLLSHLLSEEHLRAAGIDTQRQTLVQSADLDYDFLRNEFDRVIGAGTEEKECVISSSAAGSSQTSSFTAELPQQQQPETALALATTPMMTDSQCSSSAAESKRDQPMAMAQLVAKVAELYFVGDAQMGTLLLLLPKAEEQQQQQNGNGNGQSAAAKKKRRAKLRQKIQKEFESLGFVSSAFHESKGTQSNFGGIANLPRDLRKSLNEAANNCKQLCSKNGQQIPCQDLLPVERALAELTKCIQQQNKKNGSNNNGEVKDSLLRAMQEANLFGQLLELCVRSEQQRKEMGGGPDEHCSNKNNKLSTTNEAIMNRFIHKVLRLLVLIAADDNADGNIVVGKLLNGKSLLAICELFQLIARKLIIVPPTTECQQQQQQFDADHPTMSHALSILSILTRLVAADGSNDTKVPDLLLAHLCTFGCLPHFLAHCGGRLESAEMCAASRMEKGEREELLFPSGSGVSSSICQVLTDFVAATFLALQSQQQQHKGAAAAAGIEEEATSRRDSASCCGQSDNGSSVRTTTTETLVSSSSGTHSQPTTNIGAAGGGGQQQKSSAERMRSAGLLWLYLLTIHAYHQFGRFPAENPSPAGSPPMPSPGKEEKATLHTLANCFLRLFNTFAGSNGNGAKLISAFLELEREQMLATRLTCILRSILHMLTTTTTAAKGVKEHGEDDGQQLTMMLMRECLVAIGHFASISPRHQLLCVFGWHRSIIASLCQLPLEFVLNAPHKHLLLPTLCAILRQNRLGIDCIRGEFCLHYLIDYIKAAIHSRAEPASAAMASSSPSAADFQLLSALIPPDQWEESRQFFQTNTAD